MIYFICYMIGVVIAYLVFVFLMSIDMLKNGVSFNTALSKASLSTGGIIGLCVLWPVVLVVVGIIPLTVGAATLCEKVFIKFTEKLALCMKQIIKQIKRNDSFNQIPHHWVEGHKWRNLKSDKSLWVCETCGCAIRVTRSESSMPAAHPTYRCHFLGTSNIPQPFKTCAAAIMCQALE